MAKKVLFLGVFLLVTVPVSAQLRIQGQVVDGRTLTGLPFASVSLRYTTTGTMADSNGRFMLTVPGLASELAINALGYKPRLVRAGNASLVVLTEGHQQLTEVTVRAVNPAHRIVRQAVANLPQNDPEQLQSFQYEAYHISTVSSSGSLPRTPEKRSRRLIERLDSSHLYVNESYSTRQFMAPNLSREVITASRTSGSKSTLFASLRPLLQPFGFHRPYIVIRLPMMNEPLSFLNPLSPNSTARYDFFLSDTLINSPGDSTFVIEFEPRQGKDFVGLRGQLHIQSGSFAPIVVMAEPADPKSLLRFHIEQQYALVEGHWFPVELRSDWGLSQFKLANVSLIFQTRSFLTNIRLNPPLDPTLFDQIAVVLADTVTRQTDTFWETHRLDSLSQRERNTFRYFAQLRGWKRFRAGIVSTIGEWATAGVIPLNRYLNLSSQTLLDANVYEGFRPTLNLLTSPAFSKWLRLDGKLSYGVQDQAVKYEARARFLLNQRRRMFLTTAYRFDVSEPGNVQFFIWNHPQIPYELIRTFLLSRADSLSQWKIELSFRVLKHATVSVSILDETRQPTYDYRYDTPDQEKMPDRRFHVTEVGLGVRYAVGEQFAQVGQGSITAQLPSPVLSLHVARGFMNQVFGGQYGYVKLNAHYEQLVRSRRLGETYLNLTAGITWGDLPYPYLYNARGAKTDANLIWVANHFQTMGLYEFVSDQYTTLFVTHNFRNLLGKPKVGWFRPEPSLVQGIAYGSLHRPDRHKGIPIRTLERGFFESGLLVDNLCRLKVARLFYVGAGLGVFRRWGPNALPTQGDNWAYRLVWNIGF